MLTVKDYVANSPDFKLPLSVTPNEPIKPESYV